MIRIIDPHAFLELRQQMTVIDVRSPSEYLQGHVPSAVNIPLFNDDERKHVGTVYKQNGREAAILRGLDYAGKKLPAYVKQAVKAVPGRKALMYCWRGGMRSESMAWLLSLYGFEIMLLKGGYKAYRKTIHSLWDSPCIVLVLSGKTGTGKTEILKNLYRMGQQILNLESVAHHKGSAFGAIGEPPQPTNEQFENDLSDAWQQLNPDQAVWIEDESRTIGSIFLPENLFPRILNSPVIYIEMSKSLRIKRLIKDYATFPKVQLIQSIEKIQRKLGGQHAKAAIEALDNEDFEKTADIILKYYDESYGFNLQHRNPDMVFKLTTNTADASENAVRLLTFARENQLITQMQSQ